MMFLNPEKILNQARVQKGMKVADFGSGTGYFSILAGKLVGNEGRVYSIDVLESALSAVKSKAKIEGVMNIEFIRGNLEALGGSTLADGSCDFVLVVNILFQSRKKSEIIKEAKRVLRSGGKIVLADWDLSKGIGPKEAYPFKSGNEAKDLMEAEGFRFEKDLDGGTNHFGFLFIKS